jgi:hypothetical protein
MASRSSMESTHNTSLHLLLLYASKEPELPIFLKGMTWVDFRSQEPVPLNKAINLGHQREARWDLCSKWAVRGFEVGHRTLGRYLPSFLRASWFLRDRWDSCVSAWAHFRRSTSSWFVYPSVEDTSFWMAPSFASCRTRGNVSPNSEPSHYGVIYEAVELVHHFWRSVIGIYWLIL